MPTITPTVVRLATSSPGAAEETSQTLKELEQIAHQAAQNKADILLLPEAYLGGYPRGQDFGCKVGARRDEGREEFLKYWRQAVDLGDVVGDSGAGGGESWVKRQLGGHGSGSRTVDGNESEKRGDGTREELERIARETGLFLIVGLVEKAGGSLYCSAVYVEPARGMIGKRRKVMPTGSERLIWAQASPATLKAVSTIIRGVRINLAAAICWENYMPLVRQTLYAQNINLYLAPTADGRDAWLSLMRTVALEGRCFVVSSNMCVRKDATTSIPSIASSQGQRQNAPSSPSGARGRRNSCITEEGFEIALPSPRTATSTTTSPAAANTRTRRRSILDEDGNEIVLCKEKQKHREQMEQLALQQSNGAAPTSDAVIEEDEESAAATITGTATAPPAAPVFETAADANIQQERTRPEDFISRGGSSIINPFGDVVAGPQWEDEKGIIYADVDFDDCIRGRLDLDAAGSYSRNDSFKFSVQGLELDPLPYH